MICILCSRVYIIYLNIICAFGILYSDRGHCRKKKKKKKKKKSLFSFVDASETRAKMAV
ncbi:hypothetical protein HanIR_Chr09g0402221 [Helianthus annuus]|nr:hypothetical protein HanIR_Chr09g0402221 [Helianthus annuus]